MAPRRRRRAHGAVLSALLTLAGRAGAVAPKNRPFQVVRPTSNHSSMMPVPEGLQMLAQHDTSISVVSVVGPYHSGKSFLLNALAGDPGVFAVGRKTSPETMGIWMCRTDLKAADGSEVWLMDSEGFFGPGVSEGYDAKIFTIASLLGGHLVYNTVKIIDQQAVTLLEMLARRAQLFRTRSSAEAASAAAPEFLSVRSFPPLTWVVEDFVQELPEAHRGAEDGATAWLKSYLAKANVSEFPADQGYGPAEEGAPDAHDEHFLSRLYRSLHVRTLFLPATTKEHLQDLSKLRWEELTSEFRDQVSALKQHILGNLEARRFEGRAMRGPTLERSLRFIVQALQRGMFHELPSIWSTWTAQVAQMSLQDAETWFASLLAGVDAGEDPVPVATFNTQAEEAREKAVQFYRELLRDFEVQPDLRSLKEKMAALFQHKVLLYHERTLRWVGGLISRAKEDMSRTLMAMELPVDPDALKRTGDDTSKAAIKEITKTLQAFAQRGASVSLGRAAQMPAFAQDPIVQLTNDLRHIQGDREGENERETQEHFKAAFAAADEAVEAELKSASHKLLSKTRLKELQVAVAEKCWQAFNGKLAKHKWMMSLSHYKTHKALVQAEALDARLRGFVDSNEQKLTAHFRTATERCASSYKSRKANLPMPVSETDLEAEHKQLATSIFQMLAEQAGNAGELKDTDAFTRARQFLNSLLEDGVKHARQKNVELWKVHSDEATRCALAENERVMRACGLACLFNKVPKVHRDTSRDHLIACFQRSGATARMSPSMQEKVFRDWYDKDLAHDADAVFRNCCLATSLLALVVGAFVYLCGGSWSAPPHGGFQAPGIHPPYAGRPSHNVYGGRAS